jgi:hypothetical protein
MENFFESLSASGSKKVTLNGPYVKEYELGSSGSVYVTLVVFSEHGNEQVWSLSIDKL